MGQMHRFVWAVLCSWSQAAARMLLPACMAEWYKCSSGRKLSTDQSLIEVDARQVLQHAWLLLTLSGGLLTLPGG